MQHLRREMQFVGNPKFSGEHFINFDNIDLEICPAMGRSISQDIYVAKRNRYSTLIQSGVRRFGDLCHCMCMLCC